MDDHHINYASTIFFFMNRDVNSYYQLGCQHSNNILLCFDVVWHSGNIKLGQLNSLVRM